MDLLSLLVFAACAAAAAVPVRTEPVEPARVLENTKLCALNSGRQWSSKEPKRKIHDHLAGIAKTHVSRGGSVTF